MVFFLVLLVVSSIPFVEISSKGISLGGANTIARSAKGCLLNPAEYRTETFVVPNRQAYKSTKNNFAGFYVGNIRIKSNTTIDCFTKEELHGCSARRDGQR
tara:strand:- start:49 stop:351 length:303 start_codon:yes stop_codon:yes gene_type:complete